MPAIIRSRSLGVIALVLVLTLLTSTAAVAGNTEPASCLSPDRSQWPQPSKPYVLFIADASGSMSTPVPTGNSCGPPPSTRSSDLRCALRQALQTYSGQIDFGLATHARRMQNCAAGCFTSCTFSDYPGNNGLAGCGPGAAATRRGAFIQVPVKQDDFWQTPGSADNTASLVQWNDNVCTGNTELFADGNFGINGTLRDAKRYFSSTGWTAQDDSVTYPSPLAAQDLAGGGVNGSTGCRKVRVVLIVDGDEACDSQADAVAAAADLFQNGVVIGGKTFKIPVHVINIAGGTQSAMDQIAAAGGTGVAFFTSNETAMVQSLNAILSDLLSSEQCDNADNNCNGCTDEGSPHYANTNASCCAWATAVQRDACLTNYRASITAVNPLGTGALLPCLSVSQAADPALWSCFNPSETCDNADNNGDGVIDEGMLKCGNPLHCPQTEVCNGEDDDCDDLIDENGCGAGVTAEVCDGCDNDRDGFTDNGQGSVACGTPTPANCPGVRTCKPPVPVTPGGCAANGGYNVCSNSPQAESCDGLDNDCDGLVDDNVPAAACEPPGTPPGLVFGGTSQCVRGQQACNQPCLGFIGPTAEVSDGIDNDCDGRVENGIDLMFSNGFE